MPRSLRLVGLLLGVVGIALLQWSARDRIALPNVRPIRSLRWWFPWPKASEFRTYRGYRIEQVGRFMQWTFGLLLLVDLLIGFVAPGAS